MSMQSHSLNICPPLSSGICRVTRGRDQTQSAGKRTGLWLLVPTLHQHGRVTLNTLLPSSFVNWERWPGCSFRFLQLKYLQVCVSPKTRGSQPEINNRCLCRKWALSAPEPLSVLGGVLEHHGKRSFLRVDRCVPWTKSLCTVRDPKHRRVNGVYS